MKTALLLAICILAAAGPARGAIRTNNNGCSERMARGARDRIYELRDWDAMYEWFTRYARCDSGEVKRAYADRAARLLVFEWPSFNHLAALCNFDKRFRPFLLSHVDATVAPDLLERIAHNARSFCPARSEQMCLAVLQVAEEAAGAGENAARRQ